MCQNHICCYLFDNYLEINNNPHLSGGGGGGGAKGEDREREVKDRVHGLLKILREVKKKLEEEIREKWARE